MSCRVRVSCRVRLVARVCGVARGVVSGVACVVLRAAAGGRRGGGVFSASHALGVRLFVVLKNKPTQ